MLSMLGVAINMLSDLVRILCCTVDVRTYNMDFLKYV